MRVIHGSAEVRARSGIDAAYDHFRLERQGDLVLPARLDEHVATFLMDAYGAVNAHTTLSG